MALILACLVSTATQLSYRVDQAFFEFASQPGGQGVAKALAVIVVDDRTIERLGGWPFSQEIRLRMVDLLTESGVTAIGIDLTSLRETGAGGAGRFSGGRGVAIAGETRTRVTSLRCDRPCDLYSYINVLDGTVPPSRLSGRPILIRSATGRGGMLPFASLAGVAGEVDTSAMLGAMRPVGFAGELLFNEIVVCLVCVLLYVLEPRAGVIASLGLALASAGAAFVLLRFGGRLLPPTTAMLASVAACVLWSWRRLDVLLRFIVHIGDRMAAEPSLPAQPGRTGWQLADSVDRQLGRVARLDEQVRRYRALIEGWVESLPEATLIASTAGTVLLSNERAAALSGHPDASLASRNAPAGRSVSDVLFQITASHRAIEFARQALASLNRWPEGGDLSAQTQSLLEQGVEIANARGGLSLLIKCAPIRLSTYDEGALVFHVADVSSVRMVERQRDMALRFLSHDMRSPQASILALVSQIQRDPTRYTLQRFAELVSQYATRALSLSDDFLFLAKAENLPPKLASVDPALVLGDAVDDLMPQASARSTTVNLMAEPGLSTIADVQLLRRAFVNLIGNAIKFGRESSTVDVQLSATEQHVKIAVTDDGIGISDRDQEKLFREFTQLDGSSSLSGHGLGLAFVKTVVDSLGGKLQVHSKLGEGTTFLMFLSRHDHGAAHWDS